MTTQRKKRATVARICGNCTKCHSIQCPALGGDIYPVMSCEKEGLRLYKQTACDDFKARKPVGRT